MGGTASLALSGAGLMQNVMARKQGSSSSSAEYANRMAEIDRQQAYEEKQRRDALAKATAAQRARFAATGINPTEGSSGAVIQGLETKTAEELQARAASFDEQRDRARESFSDVQAEQLKKTSASNLLQDDERMIRQLQAWD